MIALENTTPLWLSTSPPLNAHISLAGRQWDADSADCLRPGTCQSGDVASVPEIAERSAADLVCIVQHPRPQGIACVEH